MPAPARTFPLFLALAGCFPAPAYVCDADAKCSGGLCELSGFCSFEDRACASGRRYSEFAGEGLAAQCTEEPDAPTTSATSTTTPVLTEGSTATTDAPAVPGMLQWEAFRDSGVWNAVDVAADVVAVAGAGGGIVVATYDASGAPGFEASISGDGEGAGVAVASDGRVVAAGTITRAPMFAGSAWVAAYDGSSDAVWTAGTDTFADEAARAVGIDATGAATLIGRSDESSWVERLDTDGGRLLYRPINADAAALDVAPGGTFVVAGRLGTRAWVETYGGSGASLTEAALEGPAALSVARLGGGGVAIATDEGVKVYADLDALSWMDGRSALAVATDGAGNVVAGGQGWLAKFDPGGEPIWDTPEGTGEVVRAVATDDDGNVFAAGGEGGMAWLARFSP